MKRMLMRRPVTKMAGLTLLETMFGIAIGALILVAAVVFYTSTKNSQNISKAVTDVNTIVAQSDNYIAPGATALDLLAASTNVIATLQGAGYLPIPMYDPWGKNEYTAKFTESAKGANQGIIGTIAISVNSLTASDGACNAIATSVQGTNTGIPADPDKGTDAGPCIVTHTL